MELWDIYDADKKPTGRTMKRNEWWQDRIKRFLSQSAS